MAQKKRKIKIVLEMDFQKIPIDLFENKENFEAEFFEVLKQVLEKDRMIIREVDSSNADIIKIDSVILIR